ncbi:MAG: GWxTD domain-containing protein [Candidatus Eisenbacteria bacterium]
MIQPFLPILLFLAVWPLSGEDPLSSTFPAEATGNIRFQADVVLFEEDGRIAPEVTIAIPRDALGAEESDSLRIRVAVAMLDHDGQPRAEYQTELPLDPDSTAGPTSTFPVPERWLRLHPKWFEGTRGVRITVEDVTRLKIGLLDKLRGEHPRGVVEGRLLWPMRADGARPDDPDSLHDPDGPGGADSPGGSGAPGGSNAPDGLGAAGGSGGPADPGAAGGSGAPDRSNAVTENEPDDTFGGGEPGWLEADETKGLLISGLFFAWAQAEGAPSAGLPGFRSVRARLHPNPFRYYGLHQRVMTVYWERYGLPTGVEAGDPLVLVHEIFATRDGSSVVETRSDVTASAEPRWELQRFDVSKLASGGYRLEVRIEDSSGAVLASTDGDFQVVWEERRWTQDEQTLFRYAELLLLSRAENDSLLIMDRGAQEDFLRRFWDRLWPTAPGEPNPREQEFLRRIEYANHEFGTKHREGYRTDQGRVFIRFGPPDEISFNLNPQDRSSSPMCSPMRSTIRARVWRRGSGRRSAAVFGTTAPTSSGTTSFQGDPLIPEFAGMQHGLKFIFVDEMGAGDFVLVYSNLPGNLR